MHLHLFFITLLVGNGYFNAFLANQTKLRSAFKRICVTCNNLLKLNLSFILTHAIHNVINASSDQQNHKAETSLDVFNLHYTEGTPTLTEAGHQE